MVNMKYIMNINRCNKRMWWWFDKKTSLHFTYFFYPIFFFPLFTYWLPILFRPSVITRSHPHFLFSSFSPFSPLFLYFLFNWFLSVCLLHFFSFLFIHSYHILFYHFSISILLDFFYNRSYLLPFTECLID